MSTIEPTQYTVYPDGYDSFVNTDKGIWALTVMRVSRDRDLWMVKAMGAALGRQGQRGEIPLNSSRTKRWESAYWFTMQEAMGLARRHVNTHQINMHTARQASEWVAARNADEVQ